MRVTFTKYHAFFLERTLSEAYLILADGVMDIEVSEVAKVCYGIILRKITHDPISILATIITLSQTLQILN